MNITSSSKRFLLLSCSVFWFVHPLFAATGDGGRSVGTCMGVGAVLFLLIIGMAAFIVRQRKAISSVGELSRKVSEAELQAKVLGEKVLEQERTLSTLGGNKRELEQLLLAKIKENDAIRREAEDLEKTAVLQVKDSELMQDNLFTETIHEMRTPLSLVLGSLALVVQNKEPEKDMSSQLLSAYRNTLALQDLADQLVGSRHANDVASYLRVARYNLLDITSQICDLFVDWVAMNNIDFRVHTSTRVLWIWLDRRKIEYSLRTLLNNSFKSTFAYGKVELDIDVQRLEGKAFAVISVRDEGLDETESTRRGLKQVMDMSNEIGGNYTSETDKAGTVFTLYIPLGKQHLMERRVEFVEPEGDLVKLNDRQKETIAELIQVIPQKKMTGKKLLVIDDSDQIRWFLRHVFAKEYQVIEARNGEEGVATAIEQVPDLILCDVMMPVKDGFQACREIKSDPRTAQVPIMMLTAKVESEDIIIGIEAGADDYITKPFDVEILRSKVNSLLRHREQLKQYFTRSLVAVGTAATADEEGESASSPFMDSVIKNIEKHLDDSTFEAKILADSLNMSLPTLYRKIKQYSDCSILELTRTIRLKKAAELISKQQYSIQEVSELVGFNDTATFRKRFTEQFGVTPSQYGQS